MLVISASNACNWEKFDDNVAKRRNFSINDVTKYTASGNSCDVTRGTKKMFQGREHINCYVLQRFAVGRTRFA